MSLRNNNLDLYSGVNVICPVVNATNQLTQTAIDNTPLVLQFPTGTNNVNSWWDTATGKFTPVTPYATYWAISLFVISVDPNTAVAITRQVYIRKNGTTNMGGWMTIRLGQNGFTRASQVNTIVQLDGVNDYVEAIFYQTNTDTLSMTVAASTANFSATRIQICRVS